MRQYKLLLIGLAMLILLSPLGLIASGTAFGEWGIEELKTKAGFVPTGLAKLAATWQHALLPDYSIPGLTNNLFQSALGYIASGIVGIGLIFVLTYALRKFISTPEDN